VVAGDGSGIAAQAGWGMPLASLPLLADWPAALLRLLLPLRCLVCGDPGHDDLDLCRTCLADLPWSGRACWRCALPLPDHAMIVWCSGRERAQPQAATHASLL